jgi:hypothetical protein
MACSKKVYTSESKAERNIPREREIPGRCRVRGCPFPEGCPDHDREEQEPNKKIEALMRRPTNGTRRLRG